MFPIILQDNGGVMNKKYQIIYADPPWQYRKSPNIHNGHECNTAEDNYPTMSMLEIARLPIVNIAADNSALFLWITNPRLYGDRNTNAQITPFHIMREWGFDYRTILTWVKKPGLGMGSYFRGDTEHVLFGIRGQMPIPKSIRESNVIIAARSRHSQKPEAMRDLIMRVYPNTSRIELFARRKALGWDCWGNEVDSDINLIV